MIRINNIKADLNATMDDLKEIVSIKTGLAPEYITSLKIVKKSQEKIRTELGFLKI